MAGYIIKYKNNKYLNFDGYREQNKLGIKNAMQSMLKEKELGWLFNRAIILLDSSFKNTCKFPVQDLDKDLSKIVRIPKEKMPEIKTKLLIRNCSEIHSLDNYLCVPFKDVQYNDKYNKIKYFPTLKFEGTLYVVIGARNKKNSEKCIVCDIA